MDELVAALKGEDVDDGEEISMNISDCTGVNDPANYTRKGKQKQFDPYKVDRLSAVPTWIKACFVKFWFAGMVCYFIMWGIGLDNALDSVVLCGAVMGLIVDMLVNPLFRYMESDRKEYDNFIMFPFPFKQFWTFFTNILYYIVVLLLVMLCYTGVNEICNLIAGTTTTIHVGVEPLLFGVFTVIVDMAFIGLKDLVVYVIKRIKNHKMENVNV
jgi:uncharacterized membrane protein